VYVRSTKSNGECNFAPPPATQENIGGFETSGLSFDAHRTNICGTNMDKRMFSLMIQESKTTLQAFPLHNLNPGCLSASGRAWNTFQLGGFMFSMPDLGKWRAI
jgi:hypothetical protein